MPDTELIAKYRTLIARQRKHIDCQARANVRYKRTIKLMESAHMALMLERDNLLTARIAMGGL